jgi:hypothetical protein
MSILVAIGLYGCELWDLHDTNIDQFCTAWRKGLRRALCLTFDAHSRYLPGLLNTLPLFAEICKRSACFILRCIFSVSPLVRSVVMRSVRCFNSYFFRNVCVCCNVFGWSVNDFLNGKIRLSKSLFVRHNRFLMSDSDADVCSFLLELIRLRDGQLSFVGDSNFLCVQDINCLIKCISSD